MVGGRRALLFAAALGLDVVLGGPLLARDDGAFSVLQNGSVDIVVTTAALTKKPPPIPPLKSTSSPTTSPDVATEPAPQQSSSQGSPPTIPTRLQGGPPQIPTAKPTASEEASLNLGNLPGKTLVGVDAGAASPISTAEEYPYPGLWGASGTLVTDVNAPTRSVVPTIGSVAPTSSIILPPPTEQPGPMKADPIAPPLGPDGGEVYGSGDGLVVTPVNTTAAAAAPTAPRGPPPKVITTGQPTKTVSSSFDLGLDTQPTPGSPQSYMPSHGPVSNVSMVATIPITTSEPVSFCQSSDLTKAPTSYSIIYTSTITWVGDPADYTPEYPPISTPAPTPSCIVPPTPARLTISTIAFCSSTGAGTRFVTCLTTTSTYTFGYQVSTTAALMAPAGTVIIITTDKNPAVVYSTPKPPNYGITTEPKTRDNHDPVTDGEPISTPAYNADPPTSPMRQPPTTSPVTVAVKPTAVVINGNTIVDDPSGKTQVVVVSGVTFTIGPTQVIGGGATIDRPAVTGGVFVPTPTTTQLGGLDVVVSSSIAVVGGSSFTLGATPRTAVVSGQTVVISPTAVAVGSQTFTLPTKPAPTEEVVAGGDLITAIGQSVVVIRSTTITYGLSGTSTTVIDDDTIVLGPGGVTAHGTTLGGTSAKPDATDYAVVGGATITKVGASVVVINSVTFTVGPGTGTTTTVVGGETITIGPDGVKVSTLSLGYPFGPTTIITPGATAGDPTATSTAAAAEDMAAGLRSDIPALMAVMCMAVGFMVVGV